ncbi:MAG: glycosyltransferase family A protein [Planctomycetaceae bacterium]
MVNISDVSLADSGFPVSSHRRFPIEETHHAADQFGSSELMTPAEKITVVVPALNEEQHVASCLHALTHQTYPKQYYEIILVDNGSTDGTIEIAQGFPVTILHEPIKSAYHARNRAIRHSNNQWLAFTDADCIPDADWLTRLLERAHELNAWVVGGLTRYNMIFDTLGNRLLIETHQPGQLRQTIEHSKCVAGGNMFVSREAFCNLGLFHVTRSGSDIEFSRRVADCGYVVGFAEHAVVRHQCDLTGWEYLNRTFQIRHGQRMHSRDPGGFVAALKNLVHAPLTPGFRAGQNFEIAGFSPNPHGYFKDWLYRWANRWAGFLGSTVAAYVKPRSLEIDPPAYEVSSPVQLINADNVSAENDCGQRSEMQ